MKYIAVVVTRNRVDLLKKNISALQRQTLQLNKIVVVDNASNDGTRRFLKSISAKNPLFDVISLKDNLGGAGGFYYGIKKAYELGADYIWLMDDDTMPHERALLELENAFKTLKNENVGFIGSNVLYKDGSPCMMNISTPTFRWNSYVDQKIVQVSHSSFVSLLIPRYVVRDVGLPFKDFFIWGDDVEYTTRICKKYDGFIANSSIVYHLMNENVGVNIFTCPTERVSRFYYFYRNVTFTHYSRCDTANYREFMHVTKNLLRNLRWNSVRDRHEKIKTIKKGIRDGKKFTTTIDYVDGRESVAMHKNFFTFHGHFFAKILRKIAYLAFNKFDRNKNYRIKYLRAQYQRYIRAKPSFFKKINFLFKGFFRSGIYTNKNGRSSFYHLLKHVKLSTRPSKYFFGSLDVYKTIKIDGRQMDNCAPDYSLYINNSLLSLKYKNISTQFNKDNNEVIDSIILFVNRAIKKVRFSLMKNKKNVLVWLHSFINSPASSVGDALQRIIIINQLMWQTNHRLMGLGRLDVLLDKFNTKKDFDDLNNLLYLKEFLKLQHKYFYFKSNEYLGDTGQIIILGGRKYDGSYFTNNFTYLIVKAAKELCLPDPKILLRVTSKVPNDLLSLATDCISAGVGYPFISNDDKVIPALIDFGYDYKDACDYVTSACWEPIPGNSYEQNNISVIDFCKPFDLISKKENVSNITSFEQFLFLYKAHLNGYAFFVVSQLNSINWTQDHFMSASSTICRKRHIDIGDGGAKYNNYGVLSVAISNTVNSLIAIKQIVYEHKLCSLTELYRMRNDNFKNNPDILNLLSTYKDKFCSDSKLALELTNDITSSLANNLSRYRNVFNGRVKFGLSSPGYITASIDASASFDGRKNGEPYNVHISNDNGVSYTEISNFANQLDCFEGRFNGNVLDLMLSPTIINDFRDKTVFFIKQMILDGVFQFQINVVSSETLIKAKKDPKYMPNLIVRVWGFSTYFNSLPEEYKDFIIARALRNEHKSI